MMNDDVAEFGLALRDILFEEIQKFVDTNKINNPEKMFLLMSHTLSSLLAKSTFMMFRKQNINEVHLNYINEISSQAKKEIQWVFSQLN